MKKKLNLNEDVMTIYDFKELNDKAFSFSDIRYNKVSMLRGNAITSIMIKILLIVNVYQILKFLGLRKSSMVANAVGNCFFIFFSKKV